MIALKPNILSLKGVGLFGFGGLASLISLSLSFSLKNVTNQQEKKQNSQPLWPFPPFVGVRPRIYSLKLIIAPCPTSSL
jgi:hypothetical protein